MEDNTPKMPLTDKDIESLYDNKKGTIRELDPPKQ